MDYKTATGKTIQQAFIDYHRANPFVYRKFRELALKAINAGKKKISFKLIMNVIRWEIFMQTYEPTLFQQGQMRGQKFRINDAYGSRYARLFIREFPEHEDKIELRTLRS